MQRFPAMLVVLAIAAAVLAAVPGAKAEPRHVVHRVRTGETLSSIAARHRVSVDSICRFNGIRPTAVLRVGQRISVPLPPNRKVAKQERSHASSRQRASKERSWRRFAKPAPKRARVTMRSFTSRYRGYVLDAKGRILPAARQGFRRAFASWRTGKQHPINSRLIRLMTRASDTFGGRRLTIVSGYREPSRSPHSRHAAGRAADFRIEGVPNWALRDYLRTLPSVGVGFYPNSTFVHLDVRKRSAYWVDRSQPGAPARYVAPKRRK